ncbi:ras-related protein Rab-21-like [Bos javanicus]|uniref:ras-related protein Rab-21-like n=1 Tax=Bos javanicus TaxID=9906 RepID=UPI002AA95C62|nr:ras-related protein Rab-21-like [Bos javanicus]
MKALIDFYVWRKETPLEGGGERVLLASPQVPDVVPGALHSRTFPSALWGRRAGRGGGGGRWRRCGGAARAAAVEVPRRLWGARRGGDATGWLRPAAAGRTYSFKVVLLGEGCVGKTSLVLCYCENKFNDKHITTLQASFLTKKLNIGGKRVNLAIWDTAGQERFHALGPIYYRDSNGAILVYDITDEDSFQKVKNWVKELRKMLGNEICLCIVGNKVDLEKERHVSIQEAESYAESVGAKHYHTSAKQNKGIEELFLDLCKRMIETAQVDERAKGNGSSQPGAARRGVQIIDDEPQAQSVGGGCCSSG